MKKIYIIYLILLILEISLISRLFYIQIYSKTYINNSIYSSIKNEIITPDRGYIFDRNKKLLVANKSVYDLIIIPNKIKKSFNKSKFIKLLGINKYFFLKKIKKAKFYSLYKPSIFLSYIDQDKYIHILENIHNYKGFTFCRRSLRNYKIKNSGKIFGYIGKISLKELKKEPEYYKLNDLIGISGIEKSYEKILRGKKGLKKVLIDNKGNIIGSYNQGKEDKKAKNGSDLYLTIDWNLQEYTNKLMYNKKGGVAAIDPNTGEILVLFSSPNLDPNIFTGKNCSKNIFNLCNDKINFPLFNKVTDGLYPPGSPFKMISELASLQMGSVKDSTTFICNNGFKYGNKIMKCHCGFYKKPKSLEMAIATSCNTYFAKTYIKTIGLNPVFSEKKLDKWSIIIKSFGLGKKMNNDLDTKQKGTIPNSNYYNKKYGNKKWNALTTISNSIGQGEINITPLQLANLMSIIANKGFFYIPHIVKYIDKPSIKNYRYIYPVYTKVEKKYFKPIIKGMEKVFLYGTASSFNSKNIKMAGKTGTSENFTVINKQKISLPDHSIFTLFAPIKNPKIAIAVMIENGNWGSQWAAPIASLIAEKFISNKVERKKLETLMMNNGIENIYNKILFLKKIKNINK